MPALVQHAFGDPASVLTLEPHADAEPGPGEVRVNLAAATVLPMDLLGLRGHYPVRRPLPAVAGVEGAGRVAAAGDGVDWAPGTPVLLPVRAGTWATSAVVRADACVRLPEAIDLVQAASLRIDLPSAARLLAASGARRGDWLILDPGAGAVSQATVQLARADGVRTVAVLRRPSRAARVTALGAEAALVAGDHLAARLREIVGDRAVAALDGTGGANTDVLASVVREGGSVWVYGGVSRQPSTLSVGNLVFRDVSVRGFWLLRDARRDPAGVDAAIRALALQVAAGVLTTEVAGTFALADWKAALALARSETREGRVIFTPATG